ncbi:hypothetical protein Tco_0586320 [Tanacetum coccineum]
MLTVDFSIAFNLVDKSVLLHEQGYPLRPLLFALILDSLLHKIKDSCKLLLHAWYLDDDFISGLAMRRAENAVDLMGLLPQLHDPQSELLLLRSCMASRAQSRVLQDHILRDSDICGMDDDYLSALAYLRDRIPSFDFSGIPIDGLGQHMSPVEYRTIPKYRLMIPLFPVDVICLVCCKACLDSFGEHAVHYKEIPRVKLSRGFTPGQTALKVASCKVTKHEKACTENQHMFIPFAFDTFGFLAPEAVELLSRVQRVMHNNVMTPKSTDVVFKHIGFAIQKGLTARLVARLPSTTIGCQDGGGNGLTKTSLIIQLRDRHCKTHSLRSKCRHGKGFDFLSPPDCGDGVVRFVLYHLTKPHVPFSSEHLDHVDDLVQVQHGGFTLALLDSLFLKGLRTVKSIPPKCRLRFSRVLKEALHKVICTPDNISCWVSLLVLPLCLLKTFRPRSNLECKSAIKRQRQDESIVNAIRSWSSPCGSFSLSSFLFWHCSYNDATLEDLKTKHPFKPPPSLLRISIDHHHLVASPTMVLDDIKSFPRGIAPTMMLLLRT